MPIKNYLKISMSTYMMSDFYPKDDNLTEFKKFVLAGTEGRGVHFMMADGGFSVEGRENIQEILSKQLYLCQVE